jgi:hypothetical protein
MPWLPLAILLVAALTIAALALILSPPGEGGERVVEDDITGDVGDETIDDASDDDGEAASGANVAPPPPVGDPHPAEDGEEAFPESAPASGLDRRPDERPTR